jgi:hypothetical protein
MDSATVVRVLYGDLSDEEHEAVMARFWETCPRLAPMRDVVEEVVTYRREAARRHEARVAEMRARYDREREAAWAWVKDAIADGTAIVDVIVSMIDRTSERTSALLDAEMVEFTELLNENSADVDRCMRLLYWRAERETMAARARCA